MDKTNMLEQKLYLHGKKSSIKENYKTQSFTARLLNTMTSIMNQLSEWAMDNTYHRFYVITSEIEFC